MSETCQWTDKNSKEDQANMVANRRACRIHQFEGKNGFIDKKSGFYLTWNQGNHINGLLWIQTDHNLDYKSQLLTMVSL